MLLPADDAAAAAAAAGSTAPVELGLFSCAARAAVLTLRVHRLWLPSAVTPSRWSTLRAVVASAATGCAPASDAARRQRRLPTCADSAPAACSPSPPAVHAAAAAAAQRAASAMVVAALA